MEANLGQSVSLNQNGRYAASISSTIAWAIENDVPVANALYSLMPSTTRYLVTTMLANPFISGFLCVPFRSKASYYRGLHRTIANLNKGMDLPSALSKHLGHILPRGFITGLKTVLESGKEKAIVPVLATQVSSIWWPGPSRPMILLHILYISTFAAVIPKAVRAFGWLSVPVQPWVLSAVLVLVTVSGLLSPLFLPIILMRFLPFRWRQVLEGLGDRTFGWVPWVGSPTRLKLEAEAAFHMHALLSVGYPLPIAAETTAESCRSRAMEKRYDKFCQSQYNGIPIGEAIDKSGVCGPLARWQLTSGTAYETNNAFLLEAQLLAEKMRSTVAIRDRVISISLTLLLGVLVGSVAYGFFSALATLTRL